MIRVAAIGDVHLGVDSVGRLRPHLADLPGHADLLLLAGDLTQRGAPEEAEVLAAEVGDLGLPTIAVLGNHDLDAGCEDLVVERLADVDVEVLEGTTTRVEVGGVHVGIAGTKGFGGGFVGACATDFGEPEMKAFVGHTKELGQQLERGLAALADADVRIALLHYAPVEATLAGERLEVYPFLGSYLLAEAVDRGGADLVLHGHAHHGVESGVTPGGITVRNVAQPVIGHAYHVYCLGGGPDAPECAGTGAGEVDETAVGARA